MGLYLRAILKSHSDGVTVDTTHEETKQSTHSQELIESGTVDGCDLEKTEDNHVENHRPFATELVSSQTKEGGTDRSEEQCKCDGGGDRCVASLEVRSQLGCLDGEGMEVERIGSPSEETNQEVSPVLQAELSEQADRVLEGLRLLPLASLLAIVVPDDHTLVPFEKVAPCLLRRCEGALSQRIGRSVASG